MKPFPKLRKLLEASTPGPWETREDFDYYQGGTYLGVGGYSYENGKEVPGNTFFKTDVCRIESGEPDRAFIAEAHNQLPKLLEALDSKNEQLKVAIDALTKISNVICERPDSHCFKMQSGVTEALEKIKKLGEV